MTIHENLKFTCERLVSEYEWNGKAEEVPYWEILKAIKTSLDIGAISRADAERYCYHMNCTVEEMMTA